MTTPQNVRSNFPGGHSLSVIVRHRPDHLIQLHTMPELGPDFTIIKNRCYKEHKWLSLSSSYIFMIQGLTAIKELHRAGFIRELTDLCVYLVFFLWQNFRTMYYEFKTFLIHAFFSSPSQRAKCSHTEKDIFRLQFSYYTARIFRKVLLLPNLIAAKTSALHIKVMTTN